MTFDGIIPKGIVLRGTAVSPGVGTGKACWYTPKGRAPKEPAKPAAEKDALALQTGLAAFRSATRQAAVEIYRLAEELGKGKGAKEAEILRAQLLYLEDPLWNREIEGLIEGGMAPLEAVTVAADKFAAVFMASGDPLLQERAADIRDVAARITGILEGRVEAEGVDGEQGIVLLAEELYPSLVAALDPDQVRGLVTGTGGYTSHAAIIARALGIPAVMGVGGKLHEIEPEAILVVDGDGGEVRFNPDGATFRNGQRVAVGATGAILAGKLPAPVRAQERPAPDYTADGTLVTISANAGTLAEARLARAAGAAGIGLYRTEYAYMERDRWPAEDELYAEYAAVMDLWPDGEVVFRTFDLGGDKLPGYINLPKEDNPMLGLRGIRLCRQFPGLFAAQLKALLRASLQGRVKIMAPMVTGLEEFRWAGRIMQEVHNESECRHNPPFGLMVEVPVTALHLDRFAERADFFSLGTNDLAQYALAVDRTRDAEPGNRPGDAGPGWHAAAKPYLHPGFLRLLQIAVADARAAGRPVSICGEMAGDVRTIPLLLGLGITAFSVGIDRIQDLKESVHGLTLAKGREVAGKALQLATAEEVDELLD